MGNGCHQQAVEQSFTKIPSVELVAVLVKVVLEVFPLDAVVHAKEQPLGVADGDMDPRERLPRFLPWDHLGSMPLNHLTQAGIRGGAVRIDGGGSGDLVGYMRFDVLGRQAVDGHHFKVPHLPVPALLALPDFLVLFVHRPALDHHQHLGLPLAAAATLERLAAVGTLHRDAEKAVVEFDEPLERVSGVPPAHRLAQLVQHRPDRFVVFVPQLALDLQGRKALAGAGQQMGGYKPVPEGQFRAVHHRVAAQRLACTAALALVLVPVGLPVVLAAPALHATDSHTVTVGLELPPAALLVGILTYEIQQVHILFIWLTQYTKIRNHFR